jgi:hypothetical protein
MERTPRKTVILSDPVQRRLNSYALAAGAAGVGVLALAQTAQARIIYTAAHKQLPINKPFYLDLNHDRINDFNFFLGFSYRTGGNSIVQLLVHPSQKGNGIWSYQGLASLNCAYALPKGTPIGPKTPFGQKNPYMFVGSAKSATYCQWQTQGKKQAYLGLKFSIKGKIHFGWARFVTHSRPNPTAELTGYAYETIAGKSIKAGQTKGAANERDEEALGTGGPVMSLITDPPQPASLGMLALGAQGVPLWGRKESALEGD